MILPFIRALRKVSIHDLSAFEKFLVIFTAILFTIYFPFVNSGVVKTGVRDYRFYLPLFIPFVYFLSRKIAEINHKRFWQNFTVVLPLYVVTTTILVCLFVDHFSNLTYTYLTLSAALLLPLTFFDRLSNNTRADILALSILPTTLLISDRTLGYFSPYDIHFCSPLLNRLIELLIWLKSL